MIQFHSKGINLTFGNGFVASLCPKKGCSDTMKVASWYKDGPMVHSGEMDADMVVSYLAEIAKNPPPPTVQKTFSVIEYSSFFAVRHNGTGLEHPMGDGVDTLFDEEGEALVPGTPGFIEAWEKALNDNEVDTLEAYFP